MSTLSGILAWRLPWTEEPGGYSPRGDRSHMGQRDSRLCGFTELSCGLGPLWGAFRRWPMASFQGDAEKCGGPLILSSPLSLPDLSCCLPGVCPGHLQRFLFLSWDGAVADRPHSLLACPEFWGAGHCLVSHHVQPFCNPMDYRPPGALAHGSSPRQEHCSGLPFPPPGDLRDPRIEPMSPALASGFFTTEPAGRPYSLKYTLLNNFLPQTLTGSDVLGGRKWS